MPRLQTALTRLLGLEHPILLAPMGGVAGGRLAAAVTRAGGLGMVGSGYADAEATKRELGAAGNTRVGVGFITWALNERPEVLDMALASAPAAVMLSFGDPAPYAAAIKNAGSRMICQVTTLDQAKQAADAGADVIIAQGRDAGGHAGTARGTLGLVPAVVDAVGPIPVMAAGGIADGRGLAAALALGASGVLMGTRFAVSQESLWSEAMKNRAIAAGGDETEQTRVFDIVRGVAWPTQYPGRVVRNEFFRRWHRHEDELGAAQQEVEKTYNAAAADDLSTKVLWAGEGVDLINEALPVAEIVERTVAEAVAALERGAALTR